jgi:hypothetical protein
MAASLLTATAVCRRLDSAIAPVVQRDFWTTTYAAIED